MRTVLVLFLHFVISVAKLIVPGGAKAVIADTLVIKHQLLILNGFVNLTALRLIVA